MIELIQNRWSTALGAAALGFALVTPATAQDGHFIAQDGLVVIEMESGDPAGSWSTETTIPGYAGSSYIRWDGPNLFSQPGSDIFGFDFQIDEPGRYHFRLHNRHDHPDSTEANDVWVRMDGGTWVKVFSWQRGQWTWTTQHEFDHHNKPPAEYDLTPGIHRIEFSGRSHDFMIDRLHLYRDSVQNPLTTAHPESPRASVNDRPLVGVMIHPTSVPEGDAFQTPVIVDGRRSFDPDGDPISHNWTLRGVRFEGSSSPSESRLKVRINGEFAVPVKLEVSDGTESDADWAYINIEGHGATLSGGGAVWHPVTLDFKGPLTSEDANSPNPFLTRRLNVTFTAPDGTETVVPGFFAGDGKGGGTGDVWRCRFNPDQAGIWNYRASFRRGFDVAISLDPNEGVPFSFDGATGAFAVLPRDPEAPGLLRNGRLEYVGEHYLKARDGDFFVKTGTNSPENFMAYAGFDDVQDNGGVGIIHQYGPHRRDWRAGDPYFVSSSTGIDSKGIIGSLNYLSEQGVNALYFLPMNLGGDGQDTCPFIGYTNVPFHKTHYDISRLYQWNQVLNHAQERGILLHFVLAETEIGNENWLDNGTMGRERKLFFRELVARFGYVNGLKWNLSEENDYPVSVLREMAGYLDAIDPYGHPTSVHTHPNDISLYQALYGDPLFDAASVQYLPQSADGLTQQVRTNSVNSGRKWLVDMDENGMWDVGLSGSNAVEMRREVLYDVLFSNGGIEWYCGYHPLPLGGDVKMEDFRTREEMWRYTRIAREFLQEHFQLEETVPADNLIHDGPNAFGGSEALLQPHRRMAIFLPDLHAAPEVNMHHLNGTYEVRWFDPRTGDEVAQGPNVTRTDGSYTQLQIMVSDVTQDWIVLLERIDN